MKTMSFVLGMSLILGGCSIYGGDSDTDDLKKYKKSWQERGISNYSYTGEVYCFCGVTGPVIVVVEDGKVVRLLDVDTNEDLTVEWGGENNRLIELIPDLYPTIDELFDIALDAVRKDAHALDIEYNMEPYRYPSLVSIDYKKYIADDEITYRASALVISTE